MTIANSCLQYIFCAVTDLPIWPYAPNEIGIFNQTKWRAEMACEQDAWNASPINVQLGIWNLEIRKFDHHRLRSVRRHRGKKTLQPNSCIFARRIAKKQTYSPRSVYRSAIVTSYLQANVAFFPLSLVFPRFRGRFPWLPPLSPPLSYFSVKLTSTPSPTPIVFATVGKRVI